MPYECDRCRTMMSIKEISYQDKDLTLCEYCMDEIDDVLAFKQSPY